MKMAYMRQRDRRCGVDRRRQQHPVLLDTRRSHVRRKQPRQHTLEDYDWRADQATGIDVYA